MEEQDYSYIDFENLKLSDKDYIYFANMCHVCYSFGVKEIVVKRCGACNMISYCSKKHQTKDWPIHKEFCKAICQIKDESKLNYFYELYKPLSTLKNFEKSQFCYELINDLMKRVTKILKRKLTVFELHKLTSLRVCAVCFESEPDLLINCKICPQSSFCKKHLGDLTHNEECTKFKVSYSIFCAFRQEFGGYIPPKMSTMLNNIELIYGNKNMKPFTSIIGFFEACLPDSYLQFIKACSEGARSVFYYLLSRVFSSALTLFFVIEKLKFKSSSLVIHIVKPREIEEETHWEIIFHLLPQLKELKLVLIGSNLLNSNRVEQNLCSDCKKQKRKLLIEKENCSYEMYLIQNLFCKPDIILGFNLQLHNLSSFEINEFLEVLGKVRRPLMITSYNKCNGFIEQKNIAIKFPNARSIYFDNNPFECTFSSVVAINNTASENGFILLYKNLLSKKSNK